MVTYIQASSDQELKQILALQQKNLPKNLTKEEMSRDGFLTVEHSFELLKKMNGKCPHTIAKEATKVVGYALSMHPEFADEIDILKPMFAEIQKITSKSDTYIIMGQICVAKRYRGQGIFRGLYQNMKQFLSPIFDKVITEVDTKNTRSISAHQAIGFEEIHRYQAGEKEWSLLVW